MEFGKEGKMKHDADGPARTRRSSASTFFRTTFYIRERMAPTMKRMATATKSHT